MLIGATWGCLRVADRYSRAFPLFIIRYAVFGALAANVSVNLFNVVSSGNIPHGLIFETRVETTLPPVTLDTDDQTSSADDQPAGKTDDLPTLAPVQPPSEIPAGAKNSKLLIIYEIYQGMTSVDSWFSRLFVHLNKLPIYIGALFGAVVRTLIYFRGRKAKLHLAEPSSS